ncbi:MAG: hypothetical protein JKY32_00760 [Rhizobiales bacterium]|nr:hypothetical protein [Hyphomicrobiales bacterium]
MDIVFSTIVGAVIFLTFVIGLAVSIGSLPFAIIVAFVSAMMLYDFYQTSRDALKKGPDDNSTGQ